MTFFDYAVLLIVGISILLSVIRGLVREVLALLAWLVAFGVASLFAAGAAPFLDGLIASAQLRVLTAFLILFFVTLIGMSLLALLVSKMVSAAGLGVLDRGLGALFGLARGLIIVLVAVLAAGLTPAPRQPEWRNAMLSAPLEAAALSIKPWLPEGLSKRIRYD
ncbi:MAG: CvpA family protein [Betaproteobacteria bacterium]|nr:CvpA family protein [Betaproteobacteria bacterium]